MRKFGPLFARRLRHSHPKLSRQWHLDEMVARIACEAVYLWRAVDQEGEVLDVLVQRRLLAQRRDRSAALKLMHKLLKKRSFAPAIVVAEKLRSYGSAVAELGLTARHEQGRLLPSAHFLVGTGRSDSAK